MVNLSLIRSTVVLMLNLLTLNKYLTTAFMKLFSQTFQSTVGNISSVFSIVSKFYFICFRNFRQTGRTACGRFLGHSAFLKSVSELFSDTRNPFMMVAGGLNIVDTRCTKGSIFVSLENNFIPKYLWTILFKF